MKYGFVRVAAAIPIVKVADCKFNAQQIETQIAIADGKGVQIIIFPELSITGYTCADLFGQSLLLEEAEMALMQIMNNTQYFPFLENNSTVQQRGIHNHRHPYNRDDIHLSGIIHNLH